MNKLQLIDYNYIIDLTKFFLEKYNQKELKSLDMVIHNVKTKVPAILQMVYIFDETIWHPDKPNDYRNLIEFRVQLVRCVEYLLFRLYVSKSSKQKTIFIK